MKKVYNNFFDETFYTDELANGLKVVIFHKPDFLTTSCAFGTKYGALNTDQIFNNKEYHFNPGVAHFLEHKLFESKEKDVFAAFSNMGCNINAFTSYHETVYYFSMTSRDIKEPLNLLLDFVQDLDIDEKSVEKEKGIIIQELSMYLQNPDSRLLQEAYRSMYKNYPLKYDIGGDDKTVMAISKKELEFCYKLNYHPNNMALVITSPLNPEDIINIVKENQDKKYFDDCGKVTTIFDEEKESVVRKEYSFDMDITKPRDLYAIKIKPDFKDEKDIYFKERCVDLYLNCIFSSKNPKYQEWLDQGIINYSLDSMVEFSKSYAHILFSCEDMKTSLKDFVKKALKECKFNDETLKQILRSEIGSTFKSFDNIGDLNISYLCDRLAGYDFFEDYKILMNIKYEDVIKTFASLNLENEAVIHINECGK